MNLVEHLERQYKFSMETFGPGSNTKRLLNHIRKETMEVEARPADLMEWVDIMILSFDGALRMGFSPEQIARALVAKQTINEGRTWPDWRTLSEDTPIEHVHSDEEE